MAWASGVNDIQTLPSYVYPNPANTSFSIVSSLSGELQYTVRNTLGQILVEEKRMSVSGQPLEVNASNWANGLYYIELKSGDKLHLSPLVY